MAAPLPGQAGRQEGEGLASFRTRQRLERLGGTPGGQRQLDFEFKQRSLREGLKTISPFLGPLDRGPTGTDGGSAMDVFLKGIEESGVRERADFRSAALSRGLPVAESGGAAAGFEDLIAKTLGQKGELFVTAEENRQRREAFDIQSRRQSLVNLLSIL